MDKKMMRAHSARLVSVVMGHMATWLADTNEEEVREQLEYFDRRQVSVDIDGAIDEDETIAWDEISDEDADEICSLAEEIYEQAVNALTASFGISI